MSSNNIELEAKALLSKKDYEKLLKNIAFDQHVKIQQNYYLDSEDRELKKYGIMIRLRRRDDRNKLTMKAPLGEGLLEKSQMLTDKEAEALIQYNQFPRGEVSDFLDILHIDPSTFKILAELTTERRTSVYEGYDINISKNTYADVTDYELECDTDSAYNSKNEIKRICDRFSIEYKENTLSKENRAIAATLKK